jgi:hypothetical protein
MHTSLAQIPQRASKMTRAVALWLLAKLGMTGFKNPDPFSLLGRSFGFQVGISNVRGPGFEAIEFGNEEEGTETAE